MTLQLAAGRGFDPVGWNLVQTEAVRKEKKLRATCVQNYRNIRSDYDDNHPPAGWSWFHKAGFHDAFDREPLVKKNFPQQPRHAFERSAGLAPVQQTLANLDRFSSQGRDTYIGRGS